jgi:hypothetical protein
MASITLDLKTAWTEGPRLFGEYLHELTTNLPVTFDVAVERDATFVEFTGRPADLTAVVRRHVKDPDARKALYEKIRYVAPMPGSTVTS